MQRKKIIIANFIFQMVLAIYGLIIPKMIISHYGSTVYGVVGAISQVLAYISLLEMGIGNAALIELLKYDYSCEYELISAILSETKRKYNKAGVIYLVVSLSFSAFLPFFLVSQIDYLTFFGLTLVLSINGSIDFFFLGKYKAFLISEQKYYIFSFMHAVIYVFVIIASVLLILFRYNIICVKLLLVIASLLESSIIYLFIKKNYSLIRFNSNKKIQLNHQRGAMFFQVCSFMLYNTDIIILTFNGAKNSLAEVSVYSVYMIAYGFIRNIANSLIEGVQGTFFEKKNQNNYEALNNNFYKYNDKYLMIIFVLMTSYISLIIPFVRCYVGSVDDVNYVRLSTGILFGVAGLTILIKDSSAILITIFGEYKKNAIHMEVAVILNIIISIILARFCGINGVLIGTIVANVYLDYSLISYVTIEILKNDYNKIIKDIGCFLLLFVIISVMEFFCTSNVYSWREFFLFGTIVTIINFIIYGGLLELLKRRKVYE